MLGCPPDDGETMAEEDVRRPPGDRDPGKQALKQVLPRTLARFSQSTFRPHIHLGERMRRAGARSDGEVVDALCRDLLAVPVSEQSRQALLEFLSREQDTAPPDSPRGNKLTRRLPRPDPESIRERSLRRLAHLVLSLPEAQLH